MKKNYLTKAQRLQFVLSTELKEILVGLFLGDLYAQKQKASANARLEFGQGSVNKDYLLHLYELFKNYCAMVPKTSDMLPDKRTGKSYSRIRFSTYSLPCFNEFHNIFYPSSIMLA